MKKRSSFLECCSANENLTENVKKNWAIIHNWYTRFFELFSTLSCVSNFSLTDSHIMFLLQAVDSSTRFVFGFFFPFLKIENNKLQWVIIIANELHFIFVIFALVILHKIIQIQNYVLVMQICATETIFMKMSFLKTENSWLLWERWLIIF